MPTVASTTPAQRVDQRQEVIDLLVARGISDEDAARMVEFGLRPSILLPLLRGQRFHYTDVGVLEALPVGSSHLRLGTDTGELVRVAEHGVELYVQDVLVATWRNGILLITTVGRQWLYGGAPWYERVLAAMQAYA